MNFQFPLLGIFPCIFGYCPVEDRRKTIMTKEPINLGFCPRCKEELDGMLTRVKKGVVFCYLCSFDAEEEGSVNQWVSWAKEYKKEMM